MRVGVITFPGSLDEQSTSRAVRAVGADPVELWHADDNLARVDAVILPGGAAHGNYLRPGALAAQTPVVKRLLSAAESGLPVLGINNGFQVLCEAGLLPGALVANRGARFVRADARVRIENNQTPFTSEFGSGDEIILPVRTGFGAFVADRDTITQIEDDGQVVARFSGEDPVGSTSGIAAVRNADSNVVGIVASPEHAVDSTFGPVDPETRLPAPAEGLTFFSSVLATFM